MHERTYSTEGDAAGEVATCCAEEPHSTMAPGALGGRWWRCAGAPKGCGGAQPRAAPCGGVGENDGLGEASVAEMRPSIVVIGMGVVGHAIARRCASVGDCLGYDKDPGACERARLGGLEASGDWGTVCRVVAGGATVLLCVPADVVPLVLPLVQQLPRGTCVIESTMRPWTSRALLQPLADAGWCVAVCPERENPGEALPSPWRVLGSLTGSPGDYGVAGLAGLYSSIGYRIHHATIEVAEWSKVYENSHRMVCLGLAQDLARLCDEYRPPGGTRVNPHDVVAAAATKGDSAGQYRPGAGVGGPCIPVVSRFMNSEIVEHALTADAWRVDQIATAAKMLATSFGAPVVLLGAGYKRGVTQSTGAPATRLREILMRRGMAVALWDPEFQAPLPERYVAVVCTVDVQDPAVAAILAGATGWIDPTGQDPAHAF